MASTTLAERLAELLGLPVEVIRAYGKPRKSIAFRRVRKPGAVIDTRQPSSRLMTLKDTEPQPAFIKAEEATLFKTDENELYAQWRGASDDEKPVRKKRLYDAVLRHARAVIWQEMEEQDPDLAQNIAAAVILRLPTFRQKSKFSTWVQGIANNQIKQELRRRTRSRRVFDERSDVFDHVDDEKELTDPRANAAFHERDQRILLDGLRKELSPEEFVLLECMRDGMSTADTAERLKITNHAAESRRPRLVEKLQKIIRSDATEND